MIKPHNLRGNSISPSIGLQAGNTQLQFTEFRRGQSSLEHHRAAFLTQTTTPPNSLHPSHVFCGTLLLITVTNKLADACKNLVFNCSAPCSLNVILINKMDCNPLNNLFHTSTKASYTSKHPTNPSYREALNSIPFLWHIWSPVEINKTVTMAPLQQNPFRSMTPFQQLLVRVITGKTDDRQKQTVICYVLPPVP